jgi:hypothetical protein
MKKLVLTALLLPVLALFGATGAWAAKQSICHFPPGNPANWHTLSVSDAAVADHVDNHGDLLGSCAASCETLCDDGNKCTQDVMSTNNGDCVCNAGTRPAVDCTDSNACTADACSPASGCVYDTEANNGLTCDDGNPATTGEVCTAGVCAPNTICPCEGLMVGAALWSSAFPASFCVGANLPYFDIVLHGGTGPDTIIVEPLTCSITDRGPGGANSVTASRPVSPAERLACVQSARAIAAAHGVTCP